MSGGRSSQRKGRRGELEAVKEAAEFGLTARAHGQYETLDCTIEGDMYEVKTCERLSILRAYDALHARARGLIYKCKRQPRLITVDFRDWLEDQQELKRLRGAQITITPEGRKALAEAEAQDLADIEGAAV